MNKLAFFFLMLCAACGYEKTEDDKHPELPVFPLHTNEDYVVTKLPYYNYTYVCMMNNLLYTTCEMKTKDSSVATKYLVIYDRNFKQVCKAEFTEYISIDKSGNVYVINLETVDEYTYPKFRKRTIPYFPYSSVVLEKDRLDFIENMEKTDSTFDRYDFISKELTEYIKRFEHGTFTCSVDLDYVTLLRFGKKEYFIRDGQFNKNSLTKCNDRVLDKDSMDAVHMNRMEPKLFDFDHAVLGNDLSSSGRSFYVSQHGWDYFKLAIENDTLKFKSYANSLGSSLTEYPGFNKKQALIMKNESKSLFLIERKKK